MSRLLYVLTLICLDSRELSKCVSRSTLCCEFYIHLPLSLSSSVHVIFPETDTEIKYDKDLAVFCQVQMMNAFIQVNKWILVLGLIDQSDALNPLYTRIYTLRLREVIHYHM